MADDGEPPPAAGPLPMDVDGGGKMSPSPPVDSEKGSKATEGAGSTGDGDDGDSDVELEGIDMEGLEDGAEAEADESSEKDAEPSVAPTNGAPAGGAQGVQAVAAASATEGAGAGAGASAGAGAAASEVEEEVHAYDEVVNEHEAKLRELRERHQADEREEGGDAAKRLQYLMAQSEVFTHFLENASLDQAKSKKSKGKGKGKAEGVRGRMKEAEEDKLLMRNAQTTARVTRLTKQPSNIMFGTMRGYQLEGLNWMIKLHDNGINGILADEMGLGKTLQSISLLAYLRESRGIKGPHIVIVPKSTVGNWLKEFKRWCPSIRTVKLLGSKEERKRVVAEVITPLKFDACVCSYESVLKEASALKKISWRYLMIDEAHRIKNEKSSLSIIVRELSTRFRLLITGTPLQNNLHELWALLNFLLPDIFSSADTFDTWFSLGDEEARANVLKKLHTILRPFMIRRIKADVEKDLPPKREVKLFIGMTQTQRQLYKDLLSKDAHNLNVLGGPERMRLLNILMQLRKVCNHPYLFDGVEPGPPFENGPHLWTSAGKMQLLHKLLPKLRAQGSRVLIFCQMTRLLDILEDYMHITGYDYCRIDGSTDGESRDSQMDEFNEPGSPKFCFLLSTRAGGLGINLATADVVILYDSDWNPQVDLQAMDRAHRIGQTKPVRVFRFITEKTVEEKIIERADKKLFLDAAVIQQGRLAEKNSSLSKGELMAMVRFGADEILRADDGVGLTDEDIDTLLQRGEDKTKELNSRFQTDVQHNLKDFALDGDGEVQLLTFEGEVYNGASKGPGMGNFLNLPRRDRTKKDYSTDAYFRSKLSSEKGPATTKKKKGPVMHDFQFYDKGAIEALQAKEQSLHEQRLTNIALIKELRAKLRLGEPVEEEAERLEASLPELELSPAEQERKKILMESAFGDWTRRDVRALVSASERNGRDAVDAVVREICAETAKDEDNVRRYYKVFWKRVRELSDAARILEKVEKGERRIQRAKQIREAIEIKVSRHKNPWRDLTINYAGAKGKNFTEEEDAFLVNMMAAKGYGNWETIRMEIRKAWQFRFDWFFKSRNAFELQRRGDSLIRLIEKENEELGDSGKAGGGRKRKSSGMMSPGDLPPSSAAKKKKAGAGGGGARTPASSVKKGKKKQQ